MYEPKLILDEKPKFSWQKIPDATSYSVYLIQLSSPHDVKVIWQQEDISSLEIEYPGEPQLELGIVYLLYIKSNLECPCHWRLRPQCCPVIQVIGRVDAN
ncbi:hypothetical protein H6G17_01780 [Chroococcidiopsis sp. FACHB-1243]|uniref:hypothetical protein n=1 Tax=Chroococcidiopsis sp. [FACHB-1243] TaxID=2692781 RepID=UPI001784E0B5|nr:hypothetical protein [Chroococcidiopsis sp. [FACHB-1243]]MBD2304253.1 hypothetical protein [Chroococcidiopsis sp. [FACHB-1243]]